MGVQPPQRPSSPNPNLNVAISQYPLFVIPYPFAMPNIPFPSTCPCYYMESQKNNTNVSPARPQNLIQQHYGGGSSGGYPQMAGVIGFIPVLFVPFCGTNDTSRPNANYQSPAFPSALTMQYPCSVCNYNQQQQQGIRGRSLDMQQLPEQNSFQQVLALANIDPFAGSFVKSPHRRMRARRVRVNPPLEPIVVQDEAAMGPPLDPIGMPFDDSEMKK